MSPGMSDDRDAARELEADVRRQFREWDRELVRDFLETSTPEEVALALVEADDPDPLPLHRRLAGHYERVLVRDGAAGMGLSRTKNPQRAAKTFDPKRPDASRHDPIWSGGGGGSPRGRTRSMSAPATQRDEWITRSTARRTLGISMSTMKRWAKERGLETRQPNRAVLYRRADIEAILEAGRVDEPRVPPQFERDPEGA